ncbi:transcription activator effector-binding protein [Pseudalgibacter alginicilyticus]|uniref:Transcription activator effector-binding protein n=1 Tax=Pseudalgibacter alginicilyticus TaxID=1736674 RepID=A0A0P0D977_9FLAO|nr:SRPBCC family protein [Pseudalgibacter alginicilyticus]ALJ04437.1 transcription activator effector-binding protein [Pseudalgibacter alginicilyticus]
MKVFKYLLFLILIGIIGTSIYIAVQPNFFEVSRSKTIKAPAAVIYNNIIDFKNWESWSAWIEKDPTIKLTYPEQTQGVNGAYSWEEEDGMGTIKTIEATPNKTITQQMQFADYPASDITWNFTSKENDFTEVTWTITGKDLPFNFKAYSTVSGGMEKQIGPYFERGLEKLDSVIVSNMKKYSVVINGITEHSGGYYIYNTASCKIDQLETKMQEMFPQIQNFALKNNIQIAGAPFVYYHKWDEQNNAAMFSCCIPTTTKVITTESDILTGQLMPFKAISTTLKGNYNHLKEAWETTMNYIPENDFTLDNNGPMLETYLTDPVNTPNPANWVTQIFIAITE